MFESTFLEKAQLKKTWPMIYPTSPQNIQQSQVEMSHCLSTLKELSRPHLSLQRRTANLGFLGPYALGKLISLARAAKWVKKIIHGATNCSSIPGNSIVTNTLHYWHGLIPMLQNCFPQFHIGEPFDWEPSYQLKASASDVSVPNPANKDGLLICLEHVQSSDVNCPCCLFKVLEPKTSWWFLGGHQMSRGWSFSIPNKSIGNLSCFGDHPLGGNASIDGVGEDFRKYPVD